MLVIQNKELRTSNNDIILEKFFNSDLPFTFNHFKCNSLDNINWIQSFVVRNILSKSKLNLCGFEENEIKQDDFYVYSRIKSIKVGFEYFFNEYLSIEERPLIYHLLSLIPGALYETDLGKCDIIYHSHFNGNQFQNFFQNKKYIFFSGEKYPFPSEKYNLSISYKSDSNNSVCYPFFFTVLHTYQPRYDSIFYLNNSNNIPNEFCAFVVSNPNCQIRNTFFQYVSQNYKKVKSYGKCLNNVGYVLDFPYNDQRQMELLSKHKFVICFENTKLDEYYITEKILIAKASGCVPIYWGSKKCLELFNPNSFLYLEDETPQSFKKLLNKIILLDKNSDLYLKIRNTPLINDEIKLRFDKSNLQSKINKILFPLKSHPYLENCPPFFYINMNRSTDRRAKMEKLFHDFGISNYNRVEAVDGNKIVHLEPRLSKYEEATTLSHLKAVHEFYESGLDSAIICEDDLSLEWIDLWKKSLNEIINEAPIDFEILQLAYTLYPHNFHHIKQDYNPFLLVTFNGAMAYYITRKGAEKILKEHTYQNPRLNKYIKIRPVSDVLIFDLAKTYTYKYCLFTYPDDNKSTIHNDHLSIHINSKICAKMVYDKL
jgi:GR25 family glycosyltransferase involved in LPS biosynthesis